jgi:DNA sulfur modification protein DndC
MRSVLDKYRAADGSKILGLGGLRGGESKQRDDKLEASKARSLPIIGCQAGGECGMGVWLDNKISDKSDHLNILSHWSECHVFDWLQGADYRYVSALTPFTKRIWDIYNPPDLTAEAKWREYTQGLRFGCIGCPAVQRDRVLERYARYDAKYGHLRALYGVWREMREPGHRLCKVKDGKKRHGPLTMEARRYFLSQVQSIQKSADVELISESDEELIRAMWAANVWPKGWTGNEAVAGQLEPRMFS